VTPIVVRSPQRTLTLEMTKTCNRKNGLTPPSVNNVMRETHTTSAAVDTGATRSWRRCSPRTRTNNRAL
jgi:hypothetical protein